ncbi:MAG: glycoside hydrolase family 5 protein [Syntrophothermus sp.]
MKTGRYFFILNFMLLAVLCYNINAQTMTDAFEQNRHIGKGVNIIGYDRIWDSLETGRFNDRHFRLIKEAGFNSVRINLQAFRHMEKQTYMLKNSFLRTLDWAVDSALQNGLTVILDLHEFHPMAEKPAERKEMFLSFWKQISAKYKDAPKNVIFEILNEPFGNLTDEMWNEYLLDALKIIRENNPGRTVIIGPGHWNSIFSLQNLRLPENDRNIIVTVHYYLPMSFTHQGAPWSKENKDMTGIEWTGSETEKNSMRKDFDIAQQWAKANNRPLYLGEFGVYDKAGMDSRVRYLSFLTKTAEDLGWSWGYWQFDSDFILYDIKNDKWNEPVLKAIISKEPSVQ